MRARRVLVLADVPGWAWARKAAALKQHLSNRFDIDVAYTTDHTAGGVVASRRHDLIHTFEASQMLLFPTQGRRVVTGITAHVRSGYEKRFGDGIMREWAARAVGFHANSMLLLREMTEHLHKPVHYVPNGVDEVFWHRHRQRSRNDKLVVGQVARPNPRKNAHMIRRICEHTAALRDGVELVQIERNSKDPLSAEEMLEFYQDIHVLVVASDMDGTPNPALEAASCECAIVSNRIGNMPEFVEHGVNGMLLDGLEPERYIEALTTLAQKPADEVAGMGRAARTTVLRDWTWGKQVENYASMWSQCLERDPPRVA